MPTEVQDLIILFLFALFYMSVIFYIDHVRKKREVIATILEDYTTQVIEHKIGINDVPKKFREQVLNYLNRKGE